jgi:hypothetical protein
MIRLLIVAASLVCHFPSFGMAQPPATAPTVAAEAATVSGLPLNLSKRGCDLIVQHEVGGRSYYDKKFQRPVWPGGASGVTVGFGYDLGFNTAAQIRSDWGDRLPKPMVDAMVSVSGLKGSKASAALSRVRGSIVVPWEVARAVFEKRTLPRFCKITLQSFPSTKQLHPHSQAALVSLVFNRGGAVKGTNRQHMLYIQQDHGSKPQRVPKHFRDMKVIWIGKGLNGLLVRREDEAVLFERGLANLN